MEEFNKNSDQKNFKGCQVQELCGCSEKELLKEYKVAVQLDDSLIQKAPEGEADFIWNKIKDERSRSGNNQDDKSGKIVRKRFGWKKLAAVGLIACMMTGGICFVAMGTKSYFYREKIMGLGEEKVLVNDSYKVDVNGENDAYVRIESELGIKPLKMVYVPNGMMFDSLELNSGYATIIFNYNDRGVYFTQTKYNQSVSYQHKAEFESGKTVFNKWINQELSINQEIKSDGTIRYETSIVVNGFYYGLSATMEEEEFIKIVERMSF